MIAIVSPLVADAGKESKGKSKDKSGLGRAIGAGLAVASDIRLKKDIEKIAVNDDGLNVYRYNYIDGTGPYIGVMAQEVKELKPEALGPEFDGYMTVDYSKINMNYEVA